jgi:hypothetical protein
MDDDKALGWLGASRGRFAAVAAGAVVLAVGAVVGGALILGGGDSGAGSDFVDLESVVASLSPA